jgi:hypothetical protein
MVELAGITRVLKVIENLGRVHDAIVAAGGLLPRRVRRKDPESANLKSQRSQSKAGEHGT